MRILSVDVREVRVPVQETRVISPEYGPPIFDAAAKVVLEVHTDAGHVGLGESKREVSEPALRCWIQRLRGLTVEDMCLREPPITDLSASDLFGHDHPQRPHRLWERQFVVPQQACVHVALLDLMGKRAGLPVHAMMGGAYRTRVPVDAWMARMTPDDSARVSREAKAAGYYGIKCKCALEDDNVARAEAIRDACGSDFKITFDPNERFYRFGEAIPMLRRLAAVGNVACVEDPFPRDNWEAYRLLRAQGLFPVAVHTTYGPTLMQAIRAEACDFVNLSGFGWPVHHGGAVCWAAGLRCWHASSVDLGILEACYLHTAAATKCMTLPCDIFGRNVREHNLTTDPFTVRDGAMDVPSGAGLGVELDRDALDRYTVRRYSIDL